MEGERQTVTLVWLIVHSLISRQRGVDFTSRHLKKEACRKFEKLLCHLHSLLMSRGKWWMATRVLLVSGFWPVGCRWGLVVQGSTWVETGNVSEWYIMYNSHNLLEWISCLQLEYDLEFWQVVYVRVSDIYTPLSTARLLRSTHEAIGQSKLLSTERPLAWFFNNKSCSN